MAGAVAQQLKKMGVTLPMAPKPVASYAGYVRHGALVYVSGQLPIVNGELRHTGILGDEVSLEEGVVAARICAINLLAQMLSALDGDLDRIEQCIRLGGFVASRIDFFDQPKVINGASEFIAEALGGKGVHARAAVGVASLPMNASVEVEGIFAVRQ